MPAPLPTLQPGDCLLYRGDGFLSWAIRVKTWAPVSHCEGLVDAQTVVAARKGGVRRYPFTRTHLYAVLRPTVPFDVAAAQQWFTSSAEGQAYAWFGLLRFYLIGRPKPNFTKQVCSALLTRWYRAGGLHPFCGTWDADQVSPGMFLASTQFTEIWRVGA